MSTTVTVTGTYLKPGGTPATGTVTFAPDASRLADTDAIVLPVPVIVAVDEQGDVTADLIASDTVNPTGWTWRITEQLDGVPANVWHLEVLEADAAAGIDLKDRLPVPDSSGVGVVVGPQGPQGEKGDTGDTGPQGPQGATGATGATGNPTAFELRGTGSPEGVTTASVGTYYTDTNATNGAVRWFKFSGTGNTGWRVLAGDTNERQLSAFLANGWTATNVWLRRRGDQVILTLTGLTKTAATSDYVLSGANVTGFGRSPNYNLYVSCGPVYGIQPVGSGGAQVHVVRTSMPSNTMDLQFRWTTTDQWPNPLPGT